MKINLKNVPAYTCNGIVMSAFAVNMDLNTESDHIMTDNRRFEVRPNATYEQVLLAASDEYYCGTLDDSEVIAFFGISVLKAFKKEAKRTNRQIRLQQFLQNSKLNLKAFPQAVCIVFSRKLHFKDALDVAKENVYYKQQEEYYN